MAEIVVRNYSVVRVPPPIFISVRCGLTLLLGQRVCHNAVHRRLFHPWPLSWGYESGLANFYQGLSPEQKLQNPARSCPICFLPPVLGQRLKCYRIARIWSSNEALSLEGSRIVRMIRRYSAAISVISRLPVVIAFSNSVVLPE